MNKEQLEKGIALEAEIKRCKEKHANLEAKIKLSSNSDQVIQEIRFSEGGSYRHCDVYTDQLVNLMMCSAFRLASYIKDLERQFEQL